MTRFGFLIIGFVGLLSGSSIALHAQVWFLDDMGDAIHSVGTMAPSNWQNSSSTCNPIGVLNNGVSLSTGVTQAYWQSGNASAIAYSSGTFSGSSVSFSYNISLGATVTISALSVDARRSNNGAPNLSVSINGISYTPTVSTIGTTFTTSTLNFSPALSFPVSSSPLQIVLSFSGATASASSSNDIDNFKLSGSVASCTNPLTYSITGGGSYCPGATGKPIGLSNSETGVSYQLMHGSTSTGSAIPGSTGQALSFGNQTTTGPYTVVATRVIGSCTSTMTGTASINLYTAPVASFSAAPGLSSCQGSTVTYTTQSGQSNYVWSVPGSLGIDYSISSGGTGSTNSSLSLNWLTAGTKTISVNYSNSSGCTSSVSATNTITVPATPAILSSSGNTSCVGIPATITASPASGDYISWYSQATGGTPIAFGNSLTATLTSSTTYYASPYTMVGSNSLSTGFSGTNNQNGEMFDINVLNPVLISSIDISMYTTGGSSTISIYYRPGTMVGNDGSASGWTLLGQFPGIAGGPGVRNLSLANALFLTPGIYGCYITSNTQNLIYANGSSLGTVIASNADLQIKSGYGKVYLFGSTFNPRNPNLSINYAAGTCVSGSRIAVPLSITGPTIATSNQTINQNISTPVFAGSSCNNLITTVLPSGSNPVSGNLTATVVIDSQVQSFNGQAYVQRHYDLQPENNPSQASATITLYFTQAEFNAYNSLSGSQYALPLNASDTAGISRLRISQYHGSSASFGPGTYSGYTGSGGTHVLIDPIDTNIRFNTLANRWEISFDVSGSGGFFVSGGINSPLGIAIENFTARQSGIGNKLSWLTDGSSLSSFEIQRSLDARWFSNLGRLPVNSSLTSYSWLDTPGGIQNCYYRIHLIGNNPGSDSYSQIVQVQRNPELSRDFRLYPNPVQSWLYIDELDPDLIGSTGIITDVEGKEVYSLSLIDKNQVDMREWPLGVYLLRFAKGKIARLIRR